MRFYLAAALLMSLAGASFAGEDAARDRLRLEPAKTHAEPPGHPTPSPKPGWARTMAMVIVGLFVVAIPVGIYVRARMPREMPAATSHDEPQGSHVSHSGHAVHEEGH